MTKKVKFKTKSGKKVSFTAGKKTKKKRGQSKAFLKSLRKKHGLGEFKRR